MQGTNSSCHNSTFNTSSSHNRAQMPTIKLQKFDGKIGNRTSIAMIHDDGGYSPAQKFYHLRSSIRTHLVGANDQCELRGGNRMPEATL